jgi:hypothetical protein
MLTRTAVLILTATIALAGANRAAAQTPQQPQPAQPTGASATPAQPTTPAVQPPSPTYPISAPIVNPAIPLAQTAPAAPAAMSDADLDTAAMLLERIQTLTLAALHETKTSNADKAVVIPSDGNSAGSVTVERATLDEIHSLAQQVALMIPAKHQP